MSASDWAITIYAVVFCLAWCISFMRSMRIVRAVRLFEEQNAPAPAAWPRLSIVIAACNEADTIERAIATLLEQDYPDLEIVLVNDRSTDGTGEIIDRIAERDPRVAPVHVESLPEKWLGKVHALHMGVQRTSGEWLLFTDADVHFEPGTLRRAIAFAVAEEADHVALLPRPISHSFWMEVVLRSFGMWFLKTMKASEVEKPDSDAFIGVGAFNLVRKVAFERTEGFPWLRMEIADDAGLGLMLHRSGAKMRFAMASRSITVVWYPTIRAMFRGSEKGGALYPLPKILVMFVLLWAFILAPFVAVLYVRVPCLWIAAAAVFVFMVLNGRAWQARLGLALLPSLFVPVGQAILSLMMLRSVVLCAVRGGAVWRGTRYTTADLRAEQRVRL